MAGRDGGGEMTDQMDLWGARPHPAKPGIDLRCCDVAEILAESRGARLVMADPPWVYNNTGTEGAACQEYDLIDEAAISVHLRAAYDCAADDAYLLCWCTWPKLAEWLTAGRDIGWGYKSGGCWHKTSGLGVGFHWRGDTEPLLLYTKGSPRPVGCVRNGYGSPRQAHSEKPAEWLSALVEAFTEPGDLVLDVYSGLAPMARACLATGRRYLGAEIDPERHQMAMARLWRAGLDR